MALPMDLSNCASLEQQALFVLERLADLQRNETTNPNGDEVLATSSADDLTGIYTFGGSFDYETVENEVTGVTSHRAIPIFDLPPAPAAA